MDCGVLHKVLFLVISITLDYMTIGSACDSSYTDNLSCTASCDLQNCGVISNALNGSNLICTWTPYTASVVKQYSLGYYFGSNGKNCESTNGCSANVNSYNSEYDMCYDKQTLSTCPFIGDSISKFNLILTVQFVDSETECLYYFTSQICNIAAPEPPVLNGTVITSQYVAIQVESDPKCGEEEEINYKTEYTVSTVTTYDSLTVRSLLLPFEDSSLFDYNVYGNVQAYYATIAWSYPSHGTTLTPPVSATDESGMVMQCGGVTADNVDLNLIWEKTGYIDYFEIQIKSLNSTMQNTFIVDGSTSSIQYIASLGYLSTTDSYEIFLKAVNSAGNSTVSQRTWDNLQCSNNYQLNCSVTYKGTTWLQLGWDLTTNHKALQSSQYAIDIISDDHSHGESLSVTNNETLYNITNLEQCVLYDINICYQQCYGSSCKPATCCQPPLQSFTTEKPPIGSPSFSTKALSSTSLQVKIVNVLSASKSCGFITGYMIYYAMTNRNDSVNVLQSDANTVVIRDLLPFTVYDIKVAAVNEAGIGTMSVGDVATTLVDAPFDPPTITSAYATSISIKIEWSPPNIPNGPITKYQVYFNGSYTLDVSTNCKSTSGNTKCNFDGNVTSGLINVTGVTVIWMNACNDNLCSSFAESNVEPENISTDALIAVVVSISILLACILFIGGFYIYNKWRQSKKKSPKPWLSIQITGLNNDAYNDEAKT